MLVWLLNSADIVEIDKEIANPVYGLRKEEIKLVESS